MFVAKLNTRDPRDSFKFFRKYFEHQRVSKFIQNEIGTLEILSKFLGNRTPLTPKIPAKQNSRTEILSNCFKIRRSEGPEIPNSFKDRTQGSLVFVLKQKTRDFHSFQNRTPETFKILPK